MIQIEQRKLKWENLNDIEINVIPTGYYHSDPSADGGEADHGGAGVGASDAWIKGNEIHVWSRAEGPYSSYWAHGRVWDRFTYTADDHWCKIVIRYHLRGRLLSLGGSNGIDIYLRLYDVTDNKEIDNR